MGWLLSFASAIIAAIAGCVLALFVAARYVEWYRFSGSEGSVGYLALAMGPLGLVGGFVIGFVVAKVFGTGFLHGTGLALGTVLGIMGVIYLWARIDADVPPEIDGDTLELMVEMRMAPDWKPSGRAAAGDTSCTLTSLGNGERRRPSHGTLDFKHAGIREGRWVVPCQVFLHSARRPLLLNKRLGTATDLEFDLPLQKHPGTENERWGDWLTTGFLHEVDKPAVTGYSYRLRVKRSAAARAELLAAEKARGEQRRREFAALNASSPLKAWLPFATGDDNDELAGKARDFLATKVNRMNELLLEDDVTVVLQTLEYLYQLEEIPVGLHAAIMAARTKADPGKVDDIFAQNFENKWYLVASRISAEEDPAR